MLIDCTYMLSLDKRRSLWPAIENSVQELLMMPLNKFVMGDGSDKELHYDLLDSHDKDYLWSLLYSPAEHSYRGHSNAFIGHREIFRKCLAEKYNTVLILEDDVYFPSRFSKIFFSNEVQNFIRRETWDGIYLGWQAREYEQDSDCINRIESMWENYGHFSVERVVPMYASISGLHAIILNKKLIKILSELEKGPVDTFLQKNMSWLKLWYVAPKVVGSLPSFSWCENKWQPREVLR